MILVCGVLPTEKKERKKKFNFGLFEVRNFCLSFQLTKVVYVVLLILWYQYGREFCYSRWCFVSYPQRRESIMLQYENKVMNILMPGCSSFLPLFILSFSTSFHFISHKKKEKKYSFIVRSLILFATKNLHLEPGLPLIGKEERKKSCYLHDILCTTNHVE